jgi:hypothetical protein
MAQPPSGTSVKRLYRLETKALKEFSDVATRRGLVQLLMDDNCAGSQPLHRGESTPEHFEADARTGAVGGVEVEVVHRGDNRCRMVRVRHQVERHVARELLADAHREDLEQAVRFHFKIARGIDDDRQPSKDGQLLVLLEDEVAQARVGQRFLQVLDAVDRRHAVGGAHAPLSDRITFGS